MDLATPISQVPKIGSIYAKRLKRLKISSLEDLVYHFPFRYETWGERRKISEIALGETVATAGSVWQIRNIRTRFRKNLTLATINDGEASIEAVWFNQPFLTKTIKVGIRLGLAGKVDLFSHKPTFINPEYEILNKDSKRSLHTRGFVPIYPETARLSSKWIRTRVRQFLPTLLPKIEEILPADTLARNQLISRRTAIWQIHFPTTEKQIKEARSRLAFDELLITHLQALERRQAWQRTQKGIKMTAHQEEILGLIASLPFNLTEAQRRVLKEILSDFSKDKPMNRLLQGDVGSGKTIVAAIVAYEVFLNGYQGALMTPTEILAIQHFNTIRATLEPYGVKVAMKTSSIKRKEPFDILVGTHALISQAADFENLALVVIDEQHRFGVEQRGALRGKGAAPHVLTMTATPIPRSLALTFYGDLDISILDELPAGRKLVKTYVVPPEKRAGAYQFIRKHIGQGRQAFIICPLIDPSETLASAKAAKSEYKRLQEEVFPELSLGLLHGRMKSKEKEEVLTDFRDKKLLILVATPVVEVGIDIPNATIMMVEAAERFGLASLHQLRGRVGRSTEQSYCLLFTESPSKNVSVRLSALQKYHVGLQLAETDLKMRGPGEIFGTAQSGFPTFKIASLTDLPLIQETRAEARHLFSEIGLKHLPVLKAAVEKQKLIPPD